MKGKCFSMCDRGQRNKSDFYQTPYSMTEQLLDNEYFSKDDTLIEPAAGEGAIVKVLKKRGYKPQYSDIIDGTDFLKEQEIFDNLITNPPYSLAFEFIQKAKDIIQWKFAMLLPLSYLHGQKRFNELWLDTEIFPLHTVYVFTRYPLLTDKVREDGKYKTGMQVYAWFVWYRFPKTHPLIYWIDNDKYVLRKGDK
jgi:hypothetical protein